MRNEFSLDRVKFLAEEETDITNCAPEQSKYSHFDHSVDLIRCKFTPNLLLCESTTLNTCSSGLQVGPTLSQHGWSEFLNHLKTYGNHTPMYIIFPLYSKCAPLKRILLGISFWMQRGIYTCISFLSQKTSWGCAVPCWPCCPLAWRRWWQLCRGGGTHSWKSSLSGNPAKFNLWSWTYSSSLLAATFSVSTWKNNYSDSKSEGKWPGKRTSVFELCRFCFCTHHIWNTGGSRLIRKTNTNSFIKITKFWTEQAD